MFYYFIFAVVVVFVVVVFFPHQKLQPLALAATLHTTWAQAAVNNDFFNVRPTTNHCWTRDTDRTGWCTNPTNFGQLADLHCVSWTFHILPFRVFFGAATALQHCKPTTLQSNCTTASRRQSASQPALTIPRSHTRFSIYFCCAACLLLYVVVVFNAFFLLYC